MRELKSLARELRPHALWELITTFWHLFGGIAGIVAALFWLYQYLKSVPFDIAAIVGIFLVSFVLLLVGYRLAIAKAGPGSERLISKPVANVELLRLINVYPEIGTAEQKLTYRSKVRCELQSASDVSFKVRTLRWVPGSGGVTAQLPSATLQLRIAGRWFPAPPPEAEELHIAPGEYFRAWIAPNEQITQDELQRRCSSHNLGTIVLLIDGREVEVQI